MRGWRDGFWTVQERGVVAGLLLVLVGVLAYRYWTRPVYVPEVLPQEGPRAREVVSTIDPNQATWQQLALLPGIGEKKARSIVEYREQYLLEHPGDLAFRSLDDLMNIRGIGEATVDNLARYLAVPGDGEQ